MQINHDPFSYLDMPRHTRFSNESSGSRRSIPSIRRQPSFKESQVTMELFPLAPAVGANGLHEPFDLCLKDEKPFVDIFESEARDEDHSTNDVLQQSSYAASLYDNSQPNVFEMTSEGSLNVEEMIGSNENSYAAAAVVACKPAVSLFEEMEAVPVQSVRPLVSREGLRQAHKTSSVSLASRVSKRCKKSAGQVEFLNELYGRLGGKWDGKCRKEAMARTGLSRIQIYKWFFDRQLQEKAKTKDDSATPVADYSASSDASETRSTSENGDSQPLFVVEKVNY